MKYPRYPAYKPSGIPWLSEIPAHWTEKRFRFVAELNPVKSEVNYLPEDTLVSFVPMEAVGEYGGLVLESEKQIADVKAGYTYFADGDVVLAKITPCFENGKGALAEGLLNGIAFGTTELHVVRAGKQLNRRFLFYLTMSHPFRKIGEAMMYGAGGQKRVPEDFIKDFSPGLPPIDEQAAIATFLDRETTRIDSLLSKFMSKCLKYVARYVLNLLPDKAPPKAAWGANREETALHRTAPGKALGPDLPCRHAGVESRCAAQGFRHRMAGADSGALGGEAAEVFGGQFRSRNTNGTVWNNAQGSRSCRHWLQGLWPRKHYQ